MESKLVCAADYLSYEEGILLYNDLQEAGISAIVKNCGPPSIPYGDGLFFQLFVSEENLEHATEIAGAFRKEIEELKQTIKCPRCRSEAVFKPETLSFWQRIYYTGTEVFQCGICQTKFAR